MFTVFNKDVVIEGIFTLIIIGFLNTAIQAQSGPPLCDDYKDTYNESYVSYEDYLPRRHDSLREKKLSSGEYINSKKKVINKIQVIRYTVHAGDTLTKISSKFNVPISTIRSMNSLKNKHSITKGRILKIPQKQNIKTLFNSKYSNNTANCIKEKPNFQWPLYRVVEYKHDGLNGVKSIGIIITGPADSPVLSSAPGIVKKIGCMRGFGNYIVINHNGRFATVYANLNKVSVSEGQRISSRNVIGTINSSDKKLHFQIDYEGKPEDPLHYLPKKL